MSEKTAAKKKAVARKDMTKAQWTWKEIKRNKTAYIMIAPFVILFFIFTVLPVVVSMILSFTEGLNQRNSSTNQMFSIVILYNHTELFFSILQNILKFSTMGAIFFNTLLLRNALYTYSIPSLLVKSFLPHTFAGRIEYTLSNILPPIRL